MVGLDDTDKKILKSLGKSPLHPSALARQTGLGRTTISYRLKRLGRLGLVRKSTMGRKSVWNIVFRNDGINNYFKIYRSKDILKAYNQILDLPKHTIILSAQGTGAVEGEFKNLPPSFIQEAHRVFKRKKIILKGFSNKEALKSFFQIKQTLIKSHIGRSLGVKVFNDNKFSSDGEVMSTKYFLLLSNPKAKQVVVVKDPGITKLIHDILELLFELMEGTPNFDLNTHLEKTHF